MSRLPNVRGLHVLADDDPRWTIDPVSQAEAACAGGAQVVQLRAKHATDRVAIGWGVAIRRVTREAGLTFIVNDRFDWALACEADGVHLGQEDLPPSALPASVRERLLVGRSTHSAEQAQAACAEGLDYLAFGPLFETASKNTGYGARGLEALSRIVEAGDGRPVVAIGGIDREGGRKAYAAGASGIAVIGAVAGARDPVAATRSLAETARGR